MPSGPIPLLRGRCDKGKIVWDQGDARRLKMIVGRQDGKRIEVTIRRERKIRSLNQNAYYWGVVVAMIAEAAGYQPEEAHEALKWQFLQIHGKTLPSVKSTGDLNTMEFEEYLERCRQLGAEMYDLYIPLPNECEGP